ncbi:MAG: family 10 glycosylhydrolase, partial [Chthoniobacterales bacterium]
MRRFSFFLCLLFSLGTFALVHGAEREFRGAWVATVYNLDWPSKPGLPAATQKAQLRALLNRAAALKLNAILLQVRPASDALYASKKEPWSKFLSGRAGVSPGYDPLEFAIAEAHARGLELHAWVNP